MESVIAVPYVVDFALRYGGLVLYAAVLFPAVAALVALKWR